MTDTNHAKLGYIPALDGLRAFAIALVMMAHANFMFFENGAVGVPVFFALSGFLITTLLLEEFRQNGTVSFKAFYTRRSFRLFPALYLTLGFTLAYAWIFNPGIFADVSSEVAAAALYVYNFWRFLGLEKVMLYHTWSLGVEEQFYLFWPVILFVALKSNRIQAVSIVVVMIILFFWTNVIFKWFPANNIVSFANTAISESILLGCLAAMARWYGLIRFRIHWISAAICLVVIIAISNMTTELLASFGPNRFAGIFSVVIILYFVQDRKEWLHRWMANKPSVFIGKISYGLYLWHLPIFKIFSYHSTLPPHITFVGKFVLSFIVAVVSWYVIEKPATRLGHKLSKRILERATDARRAFT